MKKNSPCRRSHSKWVGANHCWSSLKALHRSVLERVKKVTSPRYQDREKKSLWRGKPRNQSFQSISWFALERLHFHVHHPQIVFSISISYNMVFRNGGAALPGSFQRQSTQAAEEVHATCQGKHSPQLFPPWPLKPPPFPPQVLPIPPLNVSEGHLGYLEIQRVQGLSLLSFWGIKTIFIIIFFNLQI